MPNRTSKPWTDAENTITRDVGGFCLLCERSYPTQEEWATHADACMDRAAEEAAEVWAKRGRGAR